jgi:hypothetical protein
MLRPWDRMRNVTARFKVESEGSFLQEMSSASLLAPHQILLEGSHEFDYFVVKIKGY